jgi:hypothetical protein
VHPSAIGIDTVTFRPTSKESWLIAIGIGFIHAKIASHENFLRFDDLHNQSGDVSPRDFCSPERPSTQLRGNTLLNNTYCVAELDECFA